MSGTRIYPDEPAGPFEPPPRSFTDRDGRTIDIRSYDGSEEEYERAVEMYLAFDPADRAQGIPPGREDRVRTWLDTILDGDSLNVLAWHDDRVVGHATLVPDGEAYELAIFVLRAYQKAGIGTRLLESLLGLGADHGVEKVWLTVERWNHPAIALYEKLGFEVCEAESFEREMSLRLAPGCGN